MKKRFVTTLAVCAVSAVCAFSFTACGPTGIPSGEEVDEAAWKSAFKNTVESTNYTVELSHEAKSTITGTDESGKTITATYTEKSSGTITVDGESGYMKGEDSAKTTGGEAFGEEDIDEKEETEMYLVAKDTVVWTCMYSTDVEEGETPAWEAIKSDVLTAIAAKAAVAAGMASAAFYQLSSGYATTEDAAYSDYKPLTELYASFTYEGGKYGATLYNYYGEEYTVQISVKDEHVIGFSVSAGDEEEEDGVKTVYEETTTYVYKNFDKTTVSAPNGATEAIEASETIPNDGLEGKTFVFSDAEVNGDTMTKEEVVAMFTGSTIEFFANGTFTMTLGETSVAAGTYTVNGNSVTLTIVTIDGQPNNEFGSTTATLADGDLAVVMDSSFTVIYSYIDAE